jgi:hypothetical protein
MVTLTACLTGPAFGMPDRGERAASRPTYLFVIPSVHGSVPGDPVSLSPSGRLAVFRKDLNGGRAYGEQVVVRDLKSGRETVASMGVDGRTPREASGGVFVTNDLVLFTAAGPGLPPGMSQYQEEVYVKDLRTGRVTAVSTDITGTPADDASRRTLRRLTGGPFVTFTSAASNLVPNDTNRQTDVFVKDLATGAIARVNTSSSGGQANGYCGNEFLDLPRSRVFFSCLASNLVPGDTNKQQDCFMKDLKTGRLLRLSTSSQGKQGNAESTCTSVSPDGRRVAIDSRASNLAGPDNRTTYDTFIKAITSGRMTKIPDAPSAQFSADWSRIAIVQAVNAEQQVVIADTHGKHRRFVTNAQGKLPAGGVFFQSFTTTNSVIVGVFGPTNMGHLVPRHDFGIFRSRS